MRKQIIVADMKAEGKRIAHHWSNCISIGQAREGLHADWLKQLIQASKECGFRYIHLNGLLSDNMFVYYEEDGISYYNWQYIDSLFDTILETGLRPFVEFGFMPDELAKGDKHKYWWNGNITPPKDYQLWSSLIFALIKHWTQRYGIHEIQKWYYEVWSEANCPDYWEGTKEEYFELYKITSETVKLINKQLRIGGPSIQLGVTEETSINENISWLKEFLEFCTTYQLSLDFISIHSYQSLGEDVKKLNELLMNSPYQDTKLIVTEFCSSNSHRDYSHDGQPMAAYLVHQNLATLGLVYAVSYRGLSDLSEDLKGPPKSFHGGMGLINMQGIKKPSYHAYRMLNKLGYIMIKQDYGYLVTKSNEGGTRAIFYNFPEELKDTLPISLYPSQEVAKEIEQLGEKQKIEVTLHNLRPGTILVLEMLDSKNKDVMKRWRSMGSPTGLALYDVKELKEISETTTKMYFTVDEEGTAKIQFILLPFAIACLVEG